MAIVVGTLQVDLVTNTASFAFDDAQLKATKGARGIQDAMNGIDLREARGSIALIGDDIGVSLPRHLQTFLAGLPGVAPVMAAAFSAVAVTSLVTKIGEAISKSDEHKSKLTEQAQAAQSSAAATGEFAEKLNTQNLRLEDEIRILQKKPAQNALVLAAQEGIDKTSDLIRVIDKAIEEETKLLKAQEQGTLSKFFGGTSGQEQLRSELAGYVDQRKDQESELQKQIALMQAEGNETEVANLQGQYRKVEAEFASHLDKMRGELRQAIASRASDLSASQDVADLNTGKSMHVPGMDSSAATQQAVGEYKEFSDVLRTLRTDAEGVQSSFSAIDRSVSDNKLKDSLEGGAKAFETLKNNAEEALKTQLTGLEALQAKAVAAYTAMGMSEEDAKAKADQAFSGDRMQAQLDFFNKIAAAAPNAAAKTKALADETAYLNQQGAKAYDGLASSTARDTAGLNDMLEKLDKANDKEVQISKESPFARQIKQMEADQAIIQDAGDNRVKQIDKEIQAIQEVLQEYQLEGAAAQNLYARINELSEERQKQLDEEMLKSNQLALVFQGAMHQMSQAGLQWKAQMGSVFTSTFNGMNAQLSSFLNTGKANWRQFAGSTVTDIIMIGVKYGESKLLMMAYDAMFAGQQKAQASVAAAAQIVHNAAQAQSAAGLAAANATASAAVTDPFGAAAVGAGVLAVTESFAAMASAQEGALLPNAEMLVHTHPEEMVLPQKISNFIVRSASAASSGGGIGGDTHHHWNITNAPNVSAFDSKGVAEMLQRHSEVFARQMQRIARGMAH